MRQSAPDIGGIRELPRVAVGTVRCAVPVAERSVRRRNECFRAPVVAIVFRPLERGRGHRSAMSLPKRWQAPPAIRKTLPLGWLALLACGLIAACPGNALADTPQSVRDRDRASETYSDAAAAQAATEKVLVNLAQDYLQNGEAAVFGNLPLYQAIVPNAADDPYWTNYAFSQPHTGAAGTWVSKISTNQYTTLAGQYRELFSYRATYRVASAAGLTNSPSGVATTFWQDVGLESIPVFEFAAFYNLDLEIEPSPAMTFSGPVHGNTNLWLMPSTSLTFSNDVTSCGLIYPTHMPIDPSHTAIPNPNIIFLGAHSVGAIPLNLMIGTNNTPSNVFQILQIPPPTENPASPMGLNRFYNKADVIILVSNSTVTVTSGVGADERATIITNAGPASWTNFLNTNVIFFNGREQKNVLTTQLDVSQFKAWAESANNVLKGKLQGKTTANIVYVADMRTSATDEPGVRLIHGSQLPNNGLTVASPNPVYIWGDYNTTTDAVNFSKLSNNTTYTYPASVLGDAISILSNGWSDSTPNNSSNSKDTTVNAALLGGIVPTSSTSYSGGFESFPRFLENWSGKNFWYNGSIAAMFNSQTATAPWSFGGNVYYNPPYRRWAFDQNFYQPQKLPPGTPMVGYFERLHQTTRDASADPSQ